MGQHAEGVPLAAGKDRLRIDKSSPSLGQPAAIAEHGRRPAAARLLLLHQRKRLAAGRRVVRHQGRAKRLQGHTLGAVDDLRRQIRVCQLGDKPGEFPAQRHGSFP